MTATFHSPLPPIEVDEVPDAPVSTLAEVVAQLGDVPLERVLCVPPLGTATEEDLLAATDQRVICELADGILVEKAMGFYEGQLASLLIGILHVYLQQTQLGFTVTGDSPVRLHPGLVRLPDVSYYAWVRFPGRRIRRSRIFEYAPDIAVEIISASNRPGEMRRKLAEYFEAGTRRVWYAYPEKRFVRVFQSPTQSYDLGENDVLRDEELLPGFSLLLCEWFDGAGSDEAEEAS